MFDKESTPPNDPIFITVDDTTAEATTEESTTFAETTTEKRMSYRSHFFFLNHVFYCAFACVLFE